MSLALTVFSLIAAWIAVALAMLWGVLRIARSRAGTPEPSRSHLRKNALQQTRKAPFKHVTAQ